MGGICIYKNAKRLMDQQLGSGNEISQSIDRGSNLEDGRARYSSKLRIEMSSVLVKVARGLRPELDLALCLEEAPVWKALGLENSMGHCNCVL